MAEFANCTQCNGEVTEDSDFCPHCGVLFEKTGSIVCERHPDRKAIGVCIICRVLVCEQCGAVVGNRTFCLDHKKIEVQQDWANVFQSTDINDAELVKSLLEAGEFHVQVQNFNPIGFVWDGGGDSSLSRSALSKPAKVFVPIPEYLEALEAVNEWKSFSDQGGEEQEE